MSSAFRLLLFFLLWQGLACSPAAQEAYPKAAVCSLGGGFNSAGFFQGYAAYGHKKARPAVSFAIDARLNRVVSLGLIVAGSSGQLAVDPAYPRYDNPSAPRDKVRLQVDGKRTVFGMRTLFHYTRKEKMDLYSGFRLGLAHVNRSTNTGYYKYDFPPNALLPGYHAEIKPSTTQFSAQLIVLGFRYYPVEMLAFGAEFGLGAPYFAGLQACYRVPLAKREPNN